MEANRRIPSPNRIQNPPTNDLSRFGHSITILSANNAVLFGGAKGYSANYDICNDSYIFKIRENKWLEINPNGDIPCARAAHTACALDQYKLVVYGGASQNGSFAPDFLYMLDLTFGENSTKWIKLTTTGPTPGPRYGHAMCYDRPNLFVIGGNLPEGLSNDVWQINLDQRALIWTKLEIKDPIPSPRMYHACSWCRHGGASGMIILFGGRSGNSAPLNDCWGWRKHRNGTCDWVLAPYSNNYEPQKRFQHTINFYYKFLIVIGGRQDWETWSMPIEIFDTETSEWENITVFNKYRHASWWVDDMIYTHGGFELTNTAAAKNDIIKIDLNLLFQHNLKLNRKWEEIREEEKKKKHNQTLQSNSKRVTPTLSPINGVSPNNITVNKSSVNKYKANINNPNTNNKPSNAGNMPMASLLADAKERPLIQKRAEMAVVTSNKEDKVVIRQIQFDDKWQIKELQEHKPKQLHDKFIEYLLKPNERMTQEDRSDNDNQFNFTIDEIAALTRQCIDIIANQDNILQVSAPVKVFGDIHGQYNDWMNFFSKWGCPSESWNGDIMSNDYLFWGDYVDRGNCSLETICWLMALKIKYPEQIHLLRGNHEDILINSNFGFMDECKTRLDDDSESDDSLFKLINVFFEFLPFAAVIEESILCVHGGIGGNLKKWSDINLIKRPFVVVHEAVKREEKIAMDIWWSDPTDSDGEIGIQPNLQRDCNNYGNIVKYGPDIVKKFLTENKLSHIMRAHECIWDGFERFAGGWLITVFSATDYCGRHKNAGAMIVINQQRAMIPHWIYPPDGGNNNWIDDEETLKKRPPTPPRIRYNKSAY